MSAYTTRTVGPLYTGTMGGAVGRCFQPNLVEADDPGGHVRSSTPQSLPTWRCTVEEESNRCQVAVESKTVSRVESVQ
ncbi:unnamed protein product [Gongylonema pulchrum]|uniref:Riboflavin kinase n=1 Tax=Gongylonema pulchrum TaxID=637853 RepID=A0A183DG42_9BILA|nr:unnamed protein product [Gongylonema pulchrum]